MTKTKQSIVHILCDINTVVLQLRRTLRYGSVLLERYPHWWLLLKDISSFTHDYPSQRSRNSDLWRFFVFSPNRLFEFTRTVDDLRCLNVHVVIPDSKVHGTNMGPIWVRQDPGGPHVGPINLAIWNGIRISATTVDIDGISYLPSAQSNEESLFLPCSINWPIY